MKPSNELFFLVKSLTKSEKRYFKLSSSLQQGDKNYVQLFDAIEGQSKYDEEQIKEAFKGTTFINHLPSEKNHLYSLLLKSLRSFHSDKSISAQMQEYLKNIEILYNKALYSECAKIVRKAKKIASNHEEFYFSLELVNWERVLTEEGYARGNFTKNIDALVNEEEAILEKLRNLAEYQILYSKINYVFRKGGFTRNEKERSIVNEILNHHLIKGKDTALSMKASTACFYIKGLCAWTNREMDTAYDHFEQVMERFRKKRVLINELPKRYSRVLYHQLLYYIDTKNFDQFFICLDHMKGLAKRSSFKSIDLQIRIFAFSTTTEQLACEAMRNFDRGEVVVEEILAGLKKYKHKISKEDIIVYYYNISRHYFGAGDFKKSLDYINRVLNDNEANLRQDLFVFARLFNLIIHFELQNFDLLDYLIKSTARYIKKKNSDYEFETTVLKFLKKAVKYEQSHQDIRPVLIEFKEALKLVNENPYEKVTLEYFDVFAWLEEKTSENNQHQIMA